MIIEQGKIKLIKLTEEYIELVRQKRNDPEIRMTMEYREYITPEMQQKWFASINNLNNNYFLIWAGNSFIGLISATDIDWEHKITNNGGIFIWDKKYFESAEVLNASLLLTDLGFYMGMEKNYIKILKDNARSIAYNKALGYKILPGQEDLYNQKYELTSEAYFKSTERSRPILKLDSDIRFILTSDEYAFHKKNIRELTDDNSKYFKSIYTIIV